MSTSTVFYQSQVSGAVPADKLTYPMAFNTVVTAVSKGNTALLNAFQLARPDLYQQVMSNFVSCVPSYPDGTTLDEVSFN